MLWRMESYHTAFGGAWALGLTGMCVGSRVGGRCREHLVRRGHYASG